MPINQQGRWQLGHYYQGLSYLLSIPWNVLYRLIVDGRLLRNEQGPVAYEQREPGAIAASLDGLKQAINHGFNQDDNAPLLSDKLILKIHGACSQHHELASVISGQYARRAGFQLSPDTVTPQGLANYIHEMESAYYESLKPYIDIEMTFNSQDELETDTVQQLRARGWQVEDIIDIVQNFWQSQSETINLVMYKANAHGIESQLAYWIKQLVWACNERLKQWRLYEGNDNVDGYLHDLVHYIRIFNQLHPFVDVNNRTFVVVLMNYLLIQYGLPPAILGNPNIFDMHSDEELKEAVKQGMQNTLQIIAGYHNLMGYDHRLLPASQVHYDRYIEILFYCQRFQADIENQLFLNLPDDFNQWLSSLSLFEQFVVNNNRPQSIVCFKKALDQARQQIQNAYHNHQLNDLSHLYQVFRELYHLAFQLNRYMTSSIWQKQLIHIRPFEYYNWHLIYLHDELHSQTVYNASDWTHSWFADNRNRFDQNIKFLTYWLEQTYRDLSLLDEPTSEKGLSN